MEQLVDNRYRVLRPLGSGGMADVFLAHDDVLDREVALKVMSGRYAQDDEFVERFRREAQSAAALSHANIVSIYDRGESEDGTYYIAMEYLPGGTLKDRIVEGGALQPRTAAEVALQIACALQAAHRRSMVHRDIKPHNILITDSGDIKVTDFGIARAATSSTMTKTGSILGTAHYLSPEQAMGEPAQPTSDLYSLGIVLYEMLTGELPYDADTPIGIAMKHVNGPLKPPKDLDPSIPAGINAICVRLLAKNPEDRYTDDADLIEDLEKASRGLDPSDDTTEMMIRAASPAASATSSVAATRVIAPSGRSPSRPPGSRGRGGRRRRTPVGMILLILAILGLLAWATYAAFQNPQEQPAPRIPVFDLTGMTVEEAREQVSDDFEIVVEDRVEGEGLVDTITEQNPPSGSQAPQGSEISVTVIGTQVAGVPDVRGDPRDEAERKLTEAGFDPNVEEEASQEPEGRVIAQNPVGGRAEVDSEVTITVSTGPSTTETPDIVGSTPEQAAQILDGANLELGSTSDTQPSAEVPEGAILYQDPEAGTEVEEGSSVNVTLSSGIQQVVVPEVYGLSVVQAQQALEAAGLVVDPNYIMVDPGQSAEPANTALETDPLAGVTVDEGTVVSMIASSGPASPTASASASPEPTPAEEEAEARREAREARLKAQQEAREERQEARQEQQEARRDNQRENQNNNNGGGRGNRGD